ncbi:MAG: hypothetical protein ACFFBL_10120 [Promethearchaeota archaeon]
MAESGDPRKWLIAGAGLQIFIGGCRAILGIVFMLDTAIMRNNNPNDTNLPLMEEITIYLILGSFIGLILLILWFFSATNPGKFQRAISITGTIGIFLSGILPGLLVFNGGRKAKRQVES